MPLARPPFINVVVAAARPVPAPCILWPTAKGYGENGGSDSARFPLLSTIKMRRSARPPEPLQAFLEAAWHAQDRILVLDDFLFKAKDGQSQQSRYDQILLWLPDWLAANDVRFLTNAHGSRAEQAAIQQLFAARATDINNASPHRTGKATIKIQFSLGSTFPYVHDRFAIIDNELWHFGATVGGLHGDVSAATRGWDIAHHDALRFFEDAWAGDGDLSNGGRHG